MIVLVATTALFIILGILLMNGKASSLIAGYNTMTPEEQDKYDIVALSKFLGKAMFAIAGCTVLLSIGIMRESDALATIGGILLLIISLFTAVYVSTGKRFQN